MSCAPYRNTAWLHLLIGALLICGCNSSPAHEIATVTVQPIETPPWESVIRQRISLPGPVRLAFGNGFIWLSNAAERTISRIDTYSGRFTGPMLTLDFEPREIAYGEAAVWVCSADRSRLIKIDPRTNEIVAEIDLRELQIPDHVLLVLAAGEGAVWITDQTHVIQIDPLAHTIVGERLAAGEEIIVAGLGHGSLWMGSHDDGIVARVDAASRRVVAKFDVGFSIHGLTVSDEALWVLDEHGFGIVRIDPQTYETRARVPIDFVGSNLAAGDGSVWVAPAARDSGQPTGNDGIARIDESINRLVETIHVGSVDTSDYYSVYFNEGSLWVLIDGPQTSLIEVQPASLPKP
jgi:streptogramin lyase